MLFKNTQKVIEDTPSHREGNVECSSVTEWQDQLFWTVFKESI